MRLTKTMVTPAHQILATLGQADADRAHLNALDDTGGARQTPALHEGARS
jgi:hypothetical protein